MALLSFQLYAPLRAIVTLLQSDLESKALFDLIPSEACRHLGYHRALLCLLEWAVCFSPRHLGEGHAPSAKLETRNS
jgi:hypothetical protein